MKKYLYGRIMRKIYFKYFNGKIELKEDISWTARNECESSVFKFLKRYSK